MKRKSFIPALPHSVDAPELGFGFTIWVHLARPGVAADVQLFRHGLDRHLGSRGLLRSMNPLHTLVWSHERSLSLDDQIDLLVWLIEDRRAIGVELGALQPHAGVPAQRDRVAQLPAMFGGHTLLSMTRLYKAGRLRAEQVVEMLGGYRAPVTLH